MKVAFIVPHSIEPFISSVRKLINHGGYPIMYCKAVMDQGASVTLYLLSTSVRRLEFLMHKFGFLIVICPTKRILNKDISLHALVSALSGSYDILHIHSYYYFPFDYLSVTAKLIRKPLVAQFHGGGVFRSWERGLKVLTLMLADLLLVPSTEEKSKLLCTYKVPSKKVLYLPNFVDTEHFKPMNKLYARNKLGLDQGKYYLLFVGRFAEEKGLDRLLGVMKSIINIRYEKDILLLLVGDGPLRPYLERRITVAGLDKHVALAGWKDYDELPLFYNAADLFILPSYRETQPLALLEAMSCGLPVIASSVGVIPNVIQNNFNGLLLSPQCDNVEVMSKMLKLLKDEELQKFLSVNSRNTVLARYSLGSIGRSLMRIYEDVLSGRF